MPSEHTDPGIQLEGIRAVTEALQTPTRVRTVWISRETAPRKGFQAIMELCRSGGIPFSLMDSQAIRQKAETKNPQGILAWTTPHPFIGLDDLAARGGSQPPPVFLAIDHIEDPHNLGAILRSAECAGVAGVILPKHRIAPLSATTAKSSAGAITHIQMVRVPNIRNALQELKTHGIHVIGLDPAGTAPYFEIGIEKPIVLVVGSEHRGLSRLVRETCDQLIKIPMQGNVASLNASVATSIVLFDILRRRIQNT